MKRSTRLNRPHTKSKSGCTSCKARKIKCDECRPICRNCSRWRRATIACVFMPETSPESLDPFTVIDYWDSTMTVEDRQRASADDATSPATSVHPSTLQTIGCITSGNNNSNPRCSSNATDNTIVSYSISPRDSDLGLFQHFISSVSWTMPVIDDAKMQELWTLDTPQLALRHNHVLEAMLGMAALHLRVHDPTNPVLILTSSRHLTNALRSYHVAADLVTEHSTQALLVTVIMLEIQTKLFRCLSVGRRYTLPLDVIQLSQGTKHLLDQTQIWAWTEQSNISKFLCDISMALAEAPLQLIGRHRALVTLLEGVDAVDESVPAYDCSLEYLVAMHSAIHESTSAEVVRHRIMACTTLLTTKLAELLISNDARALAILARAFSLWKTVEGPWWMKGVAEYEVKGIASLMPIDSAWLMERPLELISGRRAWDQKLS